LTRKDGFRSVQRWSCLLTKTIINMLKSLEDNNQQCLQTVSKLRGKRVIA
jgi:hypothetical protein